MAREDMELEVLDLKFRHYTSAIRENISRIVKNERCEDTSDLVIDGLWDTCHNDLLAILYKQSVETYPDSEENGEKITGEARETVRIYIDQARNYEAYLNDLDDDFFEEIYRNTVGPIVKASREQRARAARESDRWAFFNESNAEADFDRWRDRLLSPVQAVALSFGKDPLVVTPEKLEAYRRVVGSPFREAFMDRLNLIEAAVTAGELSVPMSVRTFVKWANTREIELPSALTGVRLILGDDAASWKDKYEVVVSELDKLRRCIDDLPAKSVGSIYRLILGMAITRFEYRTDQRSSATSAIEKELESVGIPLKSDAIREHLKDAALALDFDWNAPRRWRGIRMDKC